MTCHVATCACTEISSLHMAQGPEGGERETKRVSTGRGGRPDLGDGGLVSPSTVAEVNGSPEQSARVEVGSVASRSLLNAAGRGRGRRKGGGRKRLSGGEDRGQNGTEERERSVICLNSCFIVCFVLSVDSAR